MGGRPDFERRARAVELRLAGYSLSQIAEALGLKSSGGALQRWLKGVPPPDWTSRPKAKDGFRARATELRLKGHSYKEIQEEVPVSKSTLSAWLKDVPMTEEQRTALFEKKVQGAARRAAAVSAQAAAFRTRIRVEAKDQIPELSPNELFIAGLAAYWAEGAKEKPWRRDSRVSFINSDPGMIHLFLAWLNLVGIHRDRLTYRVMIHEDADIEGATEFWSHVVDIPSPQFKKPTLKAPNPKSNRRNKGEEYRGCLVVGVRKSTYFYCQIAGWFDGLLGCLPPRPN